MVTVGLIDRLPGVWRGDGEGHYPTISPFGYREELTFTRLGDKPILSYVQRTWHHDDGRPLHGECGYVRLDGARIELVIAQTTGFTEIHHGRDDSGAIDFGITAFGRSATAIPVQSVRRRWAMKDDHLVVELWMSYGGVADGHHLRAALRQE